MTSSPERLEGLVQPTVDGSLYILLFRVELGRRRSFGERGPRRHEEVVGKDFVWWSETVWRRTTKILPIKSRIPFLSP